MTGEGDRYLLNFVHYFVDVYAFGVGVLLVVAVATCIHQSLVFFVFFWIQHVVAEKQIGNS